MTRLPDAPEATAPGGVRRLRLYIVGRTPKALMALENLQRFCAERLRGRCAIEVIDLAADPKIAVRDQIVAVPTLVPDLSSPMTRIVGDLSNTELVLAGLGVRASG